MTPLYFFALVISIVKINLIVRKTNMVLKPKILKWEFFKGSGKNRMILEVQRYQQKDSQMVEETEKTKDTKEPNWLK
jgi:hypothetical protein